MNVIFSQLLSILLKITYCGYLLELSPLGDVYKYPATTLNKECYGEKLKIITFYYFNINQIFHSFCTICKVQTWGYFCMEMYM